MFCDQRGDRAREDIISNWLADELGGTPPFFSDLSTVHADSTRTDTLKGRKYDNAAVYKLNCVCAGCNNGWMSRIEDTAKPHLIPMIRGQNHTLTGDGPRAVAAWLYLMALTYDAFQRPRHLPNEYAWAFHAETEPKQPPPTIGMRLAKYPPPPAGVGILSARHTADVSAGATRAAAAPAGTLMRVMFVFGRLYTETCMGVPATLACECQDDPRYSLVWPDPPKPVTWPPSTDLIDRNE